jgi:LPXTG-site transpeptidase (sortase) family protein
MKKALFYIEKILLLGGFALILIFLAVKIHAYQGHSNSVSQVESVIQSNKQLSAQNINTDSPLLVGKIELESSSNTAITINTEQSSSAALPDMSDWSEKRKTDYHEAEVSSPILGLLEIPQIDLKVAIFDKASEPHLNKGVARVLQRSKLSGEGNLSLAGHRDGFFRKLGKVVLDDIFTVKDIQGNEFNYQVTKIWVVKPTDVYVMKPTEKPSITLITCYPFYFVGSAPERYIVRAERI